MINTFSPTQNASKNAHIPSFDRYDEIYKRSIEDPEKFRGDRTSIQLKFAEVRDTINSNIRQLQENL